MSQKHVFVVYAGDREPGRVFHALTHAKQVHCRGDVAEVYFAAEGTSWPEKIAREDHPMHVLLTELRAAGVIQGACKQCAAAFGPSDGAGEAVGLVQGPDASYGQIDIIGKADEGYRVWLF